MQPGAPRAAADTWRVGEQALRRNSTVAAAMGSPPGPAKAAVDGAAAAKPPGGLAGAAAWLSSAEYAKGAIAALVQVSVTYPVHKVTFRQQIHGTCVRSTLRILHAERLINLYRGAPLPMMQRALNTSVMFGVFSDYRGMLSQQSSGMALNGMAGALSGLTEGILIPLERVQALMQSSQYHDRLQSSRAAAAECLRIGGVRELYRGVSPVLLRNGLSSGAFFAFREPVAEQVDRLSLTEGSSPIVKTTVRSFFSGSVLGACVTTAVFPIAVVKARAHTALGGPHKSIPTLFSEVLAERGSFLGLYRGCGVNVFRTLVGWGIVNAVYEVMGDF